jgi:hypothetical protein
MRGGPLFLMCALVASCQGLEQDTTNVEGQRAYRQEYLGDGPDGVPRYAFSGWFAAGGEFRLYQTKKGAAERLDQDCISGRLNAQIAENPATYNRLVREYERYDKQYVRIIGTSGPPSIPALGGFPYVENYCHGSTVIYADKISRSSDS